MNTNARSNRAVHLIPAAIARLGLIAVMLLLVACQTPAAAPAGSPSAPSDSAGNPSARPPSPSLPSPSSPAPSADPSPSSPAPTPKPTPDAKPVAWSHPVAVKGLETCGSLVLAVDDHGGRHLAAACGETGSVIRYAVSTDGKTWKTTVLRPPAGREEVQPQLALSGNTLYLAYTRVAPNDGGCGDDGTDDLGVYLRSRTLPNGAWSEPDQIGRAADHLQSLRVDGSVVHATVTNEKDGSTVYEVLTGGALARQVIGDATGGTSLRVGDDGKGRVAYESAKGIRIGTVENGSFRSVAIPGSKSGWNPVLVLVPGEVAYVAWTRSPHGDGCIDLGPSAQDGTYLATNASGAWVTRRVTSMVGAASLTVDPATGEINLVVSDFLRMVHFHSQTGSAWAHEPVVRDGPSSPVLRQDPTNGDLVVAYIGEPARAADGFAVKVTIGR